MAFTAVNVTTGPNPLTFVGGAAVPNAVLVAFPDEKFANAGSNASGAAAIGDANGNVSVNIQATDDAGTAPANGQYRFIAFDPVSGERLVDFRSTVPKANAPTVSLATLQALAS